MPKTIGERKGRSRTRTSTRPQRRSAPGRETRHASDGHPHPARAGVAQRHEYVSSIRPFRLWTDGADRPSQNFDLPDPVLSDLGRTQCAELSLAFQRGGPDVLPSIDLIVTSPMRRTLQTTLDGLGWLMTKGVPVQVRAEWQGRTFDAFTNPLA